MGNNLTNDDISMSHNNTNHTLDSAIPNPALFLSFQDLPSTFKNLTPIKQHLIKQITKSLSEILIENFRSLTLIFSTIEHPNTTKKDFNSSQQSKVQEIEDSSEFDLWLGELNKRIFNFKHGLKKNTE